MSGRPAYRVWHIPQIPMFAFQVDAPTLDAAILVMDTLADYDLFQFENRIKPDYSNASGIQEWDAIGLEWVDVLDDEIDGARGEAA